MCAHVWGPLCAGCNTSLGTPPHAFGSHSSHLPHSPTHIRHSLPASPLPPSLPPLPLPFLSPQVNFPRARCVRWRWLLRRCAELCITLTALAILVGQYITPAVDNSLVPLQQVRGGGGL